MKKMLLGLLTLLFSTGLFAQSNKEDIDMIQAMYGKNKKDLVNEYMQLGAADSSKFWKLYDEYEVARKGLGKERIALLEDYANNYDKLNDQKAITLTEKFMALNMKYTQFQQTYFKKFSATMGGLKAAKFFQLENYFESAIRFAIQDHIPFIGNLEMQRKQQPAKN